MTPLDIIKACVEETVKEIKSESDFGWHRIKVTPETWALGWLHRDDKKLYYQQADISCQNNAWFVYAHIYGVAPLYDNAGSKIEAIKAAEAYLQIKQEVRIYES